MPVRASARRGAHVALQCRLQVPMLDFKQSGKRLRELVKTTLASASSRSWVIRTLLLTLALVPVVLVAFGLWFLSSLRTGLPDGAAIGRIGQMDQATIVLDQDDRPAFTIYKEQRIDIPLA